MNPCDLEPHKCISQLFGASKKRMTAILSQKNRFTAIWNTKKMDPIYFTTLCSKEKEDDCSFKSEKLVHSYFEHEKK